MGNDARRHSRVVNLRPTYGMTFHSTSPQFPLINLLPESIDCSGLHKTHPSQDPLLHRDTVRLQWKFARGASQTMNPSRQRYIRIEPSYYFGGM